MTQLLSGRDAGAHLLAKVAERVRKFASQGARPPKLVVVQVGDNPASGTYIRQKAKAAADCGFEFLHDRHPASLPLTQVADTLRAHAADATVDGILLQLPLDSAEKPKAAQVEQLLRCIPAEKDADGLDPLNQGYLFTGESRVEPGVVPAHPIPATALGIARLLQHYNIAVDGRDVTVVGRSRLVGAPIAALLMQMGSTVSICHRGTKDLARHTREADIVVVCAGQKHLIRPEHVAAKAVLVDVGIHVGTDGKLTGDVHPDCHTKVAAYSPVPGGVGPMTVAALMENTLYLGLKRLNAR